jgi:hypothetical protein
MQRLWKAAAAILSANNGNDSAKLETIFLLHLVNVRVAARDDKVKS